ncbi:MAG: hypothetical protein N3B14_00335 [Thermoleophilia bacterium]|nr:hypothetical protein [Thermoleophilia bacterium]
MPPYPVAAMEIRKFVLADLDDLHRMIYETIDASYQNVYPPRAVAYFKRHHAKKRILERSQVGDILVLVFFPLPRLL